MTSPRVVVSAAISTLTLLPATHDMVPSVVVAAVRVCVASLTMLMSCTAVLDMPPFVVVTASRTLTSLPAIRTTLPLVAVMGAVISMSRKAFRVKVVGAPDAVQLTASVTSTSPLTPKAPLLLSSVTLVATKFALKVAPEMSRPAATTKSGGSISHMPDLPSVDRVVTLALSATWTRLAEVSMNPPSPPWGADASNWPPTWTKPLCMSPMRRIVPLLLSIVCA